jgi:2-oxoglutarate dehydrogenase E1 component
MLNKPLNYIGRDASASPATGFPKIYKMQQDGIVDQAIGPHDKAGSISG